MVLPGREDLGEELVPSDAVEGVAEAFLVAAVPVVEGEDGADEGGDVAGGDAFGRYPGDFGFAAGVAADGDGKAVGRAVQADVFDHHFGAAVGAAADAQPQFAGGGLAEEFGVEGEAEGGAVLPGHGTVGFPGHTAMPRTALAMNDSGAAPSSASAFSPSARLRPRMTMLPPVILRLPPYFSATAATRRSCSGLVSPAGMWGVTGNLTRLLTKGMLAKGRVMSSLPLIVRV